MSALSLLINFMGKTQQINAYFIGNAETRTDMSIMLQNNVFLNVHQKDMSMDTVAKMMFLGIYDQCL